MQLPDPDKPSHDEGFVIKKYNEVVHSAELIDIRLMSSSFRVQPVYFESKDKMVPPSGRGHDTS